LGRLPSRPQTLNAFDVLHDSRPEQEQSMPDVDPEQLSLEAKELLLHLAEVGETTLAIFAGSNPKRAQRPTATEEAEGAAVELAEHDLLENDSGSLRLTRDGTDAVRRLRGA
jgi:hypothetical protein